jgi:hypothetical protein
MATAPLLVRRATAVLAAACAVLVALPAVASAAPPINDSAATPADISTGNNLTGIRVAATDVARGAPIVGVDMSDATPSPDDPVLQNPNDQSNCNTIPVQGTDTVFYRLTGIEDRTAITIDTLGSTYQAAIAIFEGSISQATVIRCERGNLVGGTSSVDFVSEAGKTYFVEVASVTGSGLLNLFIRAHDIQPPAISISAPSVLAEPNGTSRFILGSLEGADKGAGVDTTRAYQWSASFTPDRPIGQVTSPVSLPVTVSPEGDVMTVQWPPNTDWKAGSGTAMVRVWDRAGNVGSARLTLKVRDRIAPKVLRTRVVSSKARKRVTLRGTCSEPGTLTMEFRNQTRNRNFRRKIDIVIKRPGVLRSATWKRVRPDVYLAQWTCEDLSSNRTIKLDNFLFGF